VQVPLLALQVLLLVLQAPLLALRVLLLVLQVLLLALQDFWHSIPQQHH